MYIPKYPTYLGINITNRCNYECAYCIVDGGNNEDELSHKQLYKILNEAHSIGVRYIGFSGGEPFLYPKFMDILEVYLTYFGINIVTNGSFIDENIANKLKYLSKEHNLSLRISLDGPTANIHELFRGKGTYRTTINAIKLLLENYVPIGVYTVLHKQNVNHFPKLLYFLKSLRIDVIRALPLFPMGRGNELTQYVLDRREWWHLVESREYLEQKFSMSILLESPLDFLLSSSPEIQAKPCIAGYLYLGVAPNGDVFPCPYMMDMVLGNINESTLHDIWTKSSVLAELRDTNLLKGSCAACQYREQCRGGCRGLSYYMSGDFLSPDPYCPIAAKSSNKPQKEVV